MKIDIKPNQVTFFRMGAVPVIALLICAHGPLAGFLAMLLYIAAALSDWYDGYLARKYEDTSLLGKVFDNVADKLLVIGCLLGLGASGRLVGGLIIPALAIALREIFVAGLREYVSRKADIDNTPIPEAVDLTSSPLAKAKTMTQMIAIGLLVSVPPLPLFLGLIGSFLLWVAAGLSLYTGYQYWQRSRYMPPVTIN
ncbi:MAG TPA: CDP-diacylglycerol--glycerol-3-phosphate 3-phosphatidyltransferase [Alphaproteobacteria bacterium]|nr:CDP-diacylglycerol--glycerol-3-phosphate 3-phosphatidyltransferase [Alphaproteobacteria bacterium]